MRSSIVGWVALCFTLATSSCVKDSPVTADAGSVSGAVMLYNEGTVRMPDAGMTVTVEGSDPLRQAVTDAQGRYRIEDVPFGDLTLVFEKAQYGTYKERIQGHGAQGPLTYLTYVASLGHRSTTAVTDLEVLTGSQSVYVLATTQPGGYAGSPRYIRFFLGDQPDLSAEMYTVVTATRVANDNPYELVLTPAVLAEAGFVSGQTVYVRAYGDAFWSNSYPSGEGSRLIFPNLHPQSPPAVSFVVP